MCIYTSRNRILEFVPLWCGQFPRVAARAITTMMTGRLTVKEGAQIAARYEVWNSMVAVQRWWRKVKGRNNTIRPETIKNCLSKFLTTGSVTDARRSGRPSTFRSEENVALVRDMFTRSPRKSTRQAAREGGL